MANARPSWTGILQFENLRVPVQLVPASTDEKDSPFVKVHAIDDGLVESRSRCKACATDVEASACVQAIEDGNGGYVHVTAKDLAEIAPASRPGGVIDLDVIGYRASVWDGLIEKPYYVLPHPDSDGAAYSLLLSSMLQTGYAGFGKVSFRTRERLAIVHPGIAGAVLMLLTLRMDSEMRDCPDFRLPPADQAHVEQLSKALASAHRRKCAGRKLADYQDDYSAGLKALVASRKGVKASTMSTLAADVKKTAAAAAGRSRKAAA